MPEYPVTSWDSNYQHPHLSSG